MQPSLVHFIASLYPQGLGRTWCGVGFGLGLVALAPAHVGATICDDVRVPPPETFDDQSNRDAVFTTAAWGDGELKLDYKVNALNGTASTLGFRLSNSTAFDWDGDGFDDLVGAVQHSTSGPGIVWRLHFIKNNGVAAGTWSGFSMGPAIIDMPRSDESLIGFVLDSGDINGDSMQDLIYIRADHPAETPDAFWLPMTGLSAGGVPQFGAPQDLVATLTADPLLTPNFSKRVGNYGRLVDWNQDSCLDIVYNHKTRTRDKVVVSLGCQSTPSTFGTPSYILDTGLPGRYAVNGSSLTALCPACPSETDPPCTGRGYLGMNNIEVVDFDLDGDLDLMFSGVFYDYIARWENDGSNNFTRIGDVAYAHGGVATFSSVDTDNDGDLDLVIAREGSSNAQFCGPTWKAGYVHEYRNDGTGTYTQHAWLADVGVDSDTSVVLNLDNDPFGIDDVIVTDGNTTGQFVTVVSTGSTLVSVNGVAQSTTVDTLDPDEAIVAVTIDIQDSRIAPPATGYDFFVSNNNGLDWEFVPPARRYGGAEHSFRHFGNQLKWRVEMFAEPTTSVGDPYHPAASDSPHIQTISLSYKVSNINRYSRSGIAVANTVDASGDPVEVVLSASFEHPTFNGSLIAYDIDGFVDTSAQIESLLTGPVSVFWDAAAELNAAGGASRTILAGFDSAGDGNISGSADSFVVDEGNPLSVSRFMTEAAMLSSADSQSLMAQVRNGLAGRNHLLLDPGHSTPIVVQAPQQGGNSPVFAALGYSTFQSSNSSRRGRAYLGTNGGMVHAFDLRTGAEDWAYIPNNLLTRLKAQIEINASGTEIFRHTHLVDGQQTVADVFDGSTWRTILISGQGQGVGKGDNHFYFALDITDQSVGSLPIPLWEFSDPWCTGIPCLPTSTSTGETWSKPVVGPVLFNGAARFLVFVASGYDELNRSALGTATGRSLYAIDALTGALVAEWTFEDLPFDASTNPSTLKNALPGSPSIADVDNDGYVDRVYIGDLEGRLWKVELQTSSGLSPTGPVTTSQWPSCVVFDAGDPEGDGTRTWAPIITRPGVGFPQSEPVGGTFYPNLYFGTGGDDNTDGSLTYAFWSIRDDAACSLAGIDDTPRVTESALSAAEHEWKVISDPDQRFWSDPLVVNDEYVIFASVPGGIESVNPCENLSGQSKIYGIALRNLLTSDGRRLAAGDSVYAGADFLLADSKVRQSAVLRTTQQPVQVAVQHAPKIAAADVLLQEFAGTAVTGDQNPDLKHIGAMNFSAMAGLRLIRWREITIR